MTVPRATTWWPPLSRRRTLALRVLTGVYTVVLALAWLAWVWDDLFPDPRQQGASFAAIYLLVAGLPWTLALGPLASLLPSVVAATVTALACLALDVLCTRWLLATVRAPRRARAAGQGCRRGSVPRRRTSRGG